MRVKKLSLFVFIDALGWDLLTRHAFLDDVLTTRAPLETILGYSSSCDPTFLTGKLPREHGHFTFYYYSPDTSPFRFYRVFSLLPKVISSRARARHYISKTMKRVHGYTGYFQLYNMPFRYLHLFDYAEKRDIWQPGGINGGHEIVFEQLRRAGVSMHVSDWNLKEGDRIQNFRRALEEQAPDFAFLYLGALDAVLHHYGTTSDKVAEMLQTYEMQLRALVDLARRSYEDVSMFVFSDHGMTDVTDTCGLMGRINRLGLRFGQDYAAAYDSTMARFWFLNDRARTTILKALAAENRGQVVTEAQLAEWGCDFTDRKYGHTFFLLRPGVLLIPSHMGERPVAGMHGYDPSHSTSTAAFLTNVEDVALPRRLDNLYDLMVEYGGGGPSALDYRYQEALK